MRIVLASEVYPPRAGGAGWSARALALALRGAGHDVSVVTTSPGPADLDGLAVTRLSVAGRKRLRVPRAPLTEIVREGLEGRHFAEAEGASLAGTIRALVADPAARARMGTAARARVVEHYSWARHCEQLEGVLRRMVA